MFVHHCLPLPADLVADMKARKLRRLNGTLNGHPFSLAPYGRAGEAEKFLLLSRQTLRSLKAGAGETLEVVCQPDDNPNDVPLPEELHEVLDQDEAAANRFHALTPGRRRSLVHYVSSAKGVDTRINRALELARKLRTYTLYGDLHPTKANR